MSKRKAKFSRTRTGCLCCRMRRKKCDGQRPVCCGCERNELLCTWPEESLKLSAKTLAQHDSYSEGTTASALTLPRRDPPTSEAVLADSFHIIPIDTTPVPWPMKNVQVRGRSSMVLLQHLHQNTLSLLAPTSIHENPFFKYVLPYADTNVQIVHILLALSGSYAQQVQPNDTLYAQSQLHYAAALRDVKLSLRRCQSGGSEEMLRLFMSTMLLCFREGIDGNSDGMTSFIHLHAARECAAWFLINHHLVSDAEKEMVGFLLEFYAYCVLLNRVTFEDIDETPFSLNDPFVLSLGYLRKFKTPGILFGNSYELYEMIPRICHLAQQRKPAKRNVSIEAVDSMLPAYLELKNAIMEWCLPESMNVYGVDREHQLKAGRVVQMVMLMFLHCAYHNDDIGNPKLKTKLEPLLTKAIPLMLELMESPMRACMSWAGTVMLSCVSDPTQRAASLLEDNPMYAMGHVQDIIKVIRLMWADPDESVFGPPGIAKVMKRHKIRLNVF